MQRAAKRRQVRSRVVQIRQAKINNLDIRRLRNEYILDLEVAVDDVVSMAMIKRRRDLTRELPRNALAQSLVADDVVEHLAPADVLEDHVVVVLVDDHFTHAADVRVVEEHGQRRLAESADLLGGVLGCLLGGRFRGGRTGGGIRGYAGQDLDGQLRNEETSSSI